MAHTGLLIGAIILLIVSIAVLILGGYLLNKESKEYSGQTAPTYTSKTIPGWITLLSGISLFFLAIILFVSAMKGKKAEKTK